MDACITLVYLTVHVLCIMHKVSVTKKLFLSIVFFAGVEKEIHTVIDLSLPVHRNLKFVFVQLWHKDALSIVHCLNLLEILDWLSRLL